MELYGPTRAIGGNLQLELSVLKCYWDYPRGLGGDLNVRRYEEERNLHDRQYMVIRDF